MEIDGGAAATIVSGSAYTFSSGGNGAFASAWQSGRTGDLNIQAKVNTIGYVTPIRRQDTIYGGIGVYNSGRSIAYVYKI
jgi:hypothetical protein